MMNIKSIVKMFIPEMLLEQRRQRLKRESRRKLAKASEARKKATVFSPEALYQLFLKAGLCPGDSIMVHSGLGTFNRIQGGAATVLSQLEKVVGKGNLIFPAFPSWGSVLASKTPFYFDEVETKSDMGTLAEYFRKKDNVRRSLHPTHSICALGPQADWITQGHEKARYAYGRGTPFYKHCEIQGKILAMGVNLNSVTSFHVYEDLLSPGFWISIYEENLRQFKMIRKDKEELFYEGYFHNDAYKIRICERLRDPLIQNKALTVVKTDYAELLVLDSIGLVVTCLEQLLKEWSIYGKAPISEEQRIRVKNIIKEVEGLRKNSPSI